MERLLGLGWVLLILCVLNNLIKVQAEESEILNSGDLEEMRKSEENCPCISKEHCPRVYGISELDVKELGQLTPCDDEDMVRCCGVTVSVVKQSEQPRPVQTSESKEEASNNQSSDSESDPSVDPEELNSENAENNARSDENHEDLEMSESRGSYTSFVPAPPEVLTAFGEESSKRLKFPRGRRPPSQGKSIGSGGQSRGQTLPSEERKGQEVTPESNYSEEKETSPTTETTPKKVLGRQRLSPMKKLNVNTNESLRRRPVQNSTVLPYSMLASTTETAPTATPGPKVPTNARTSTGYRNSPGRKSSTTTVTTTAIPEVKETGSESKIPVAPNRTASSTFPKIRPFVRKPVTTSFNTDYNAEATEIHETIVPSPSNRNTVRSQEAPPQGNSRFPGQFRKVFKQSQEINSDGNPGAPGNAGTSDVIDSTVHLPEARESNPEIASPGASENDFGNSRFPGKFIRRKVIKQSQEINFHGIPGAPGTSDVIDSTVHLPEARESNPELANSGTPGNNFESSAPDNNKFENNGAPGNDFGNGAPGNSETVVPNQVPNVVEDRIFQEVPTVPEPQTPQKRKGIRRKVLRHRTTTTTTTETPTTTEPITTHYATIEEVKIPEVEITNPVVPEVPNPIEESAKYVEINRPRLPRPSLKSTQEPVATKSGPQAQEVKDKEQVQSPKVTQRNKLNTMLNRQTSKAQEIQELSQLLKEELDKPEVKVPVETQKSKINRPNIYGSVNRQRVQYTSTASPVPELPKVNAPPAPVQAQRSRTRLPITRNQLQKQTTTAAQTPTVKEEQSKVFSEDYGNKVKVQNVQTAPKIQILPRYSTPNRQQHTKTSETSSISSSQEKIQVPAEEVKVQVQQNKLVKSQSERLQAIKRVRVQSTTTTTTTTTETPSQEVEKPTRVRVTSMYSRIRENKNKDDVPYTQEVEQSEVPEKHKQSTGGRFTVPNSFTFPDISTSPVPAVDNLSNEQKQESEGYHRQAGTSNRFSAGSTNRYSTVVSKEEEIPKKTQETLTTYRRRPSAYSVRQQQQPVEEQKPEAQKSESAGQNLPVDIVPLPNSNLPDALATNEGEVGFLGQIKDENAPQYSETPEVPNPTLPVQEEHPEEKKNPEHLETKLPALNPEEVDSYDIVINSEDRRHTNSHYVPEDSNSNPEEEAPESEEEPEVEEELPEEEEPEEESYTAPANHNNYNYNKNDNYKNHRTQKYQNYAGDNPRLASFVDFDDMEGDTRSMQMEQNSDTRQEHSARFSTSSDWKPIQSSWDLILLNEQESQIKEQVVPAHKNSEESKRFRVKFLRQPPPQDPVEHFQNQEGQRSQFIGSVPSPRPTYEDRLSLLDAVVNAPGQPEDNNAPTLAPQASLPVRMLQTQTEAPSARITSTKNIFTTPKPQPRIRVRSTTPRPTVVSVPAQIYEPQLQQQQPTASAPTQTPHQTFSEFTLPPFRKSAAVLVNPEAVTYAPVATFPTLHHIRGANNSPSHSSSATLTTTDVPTTTSTTTTTTMRPLTTSTTQAPHVYKNHQRVYQQTQTHYQNSPTRFNSQFVNSQNSPQVSASSNVNTRFGVSTLNSFDSIENFETKPQQHVVYSSRATEAPLAHQIPATETHHPVYVNSVPVPSTEAPLSYFHHQTGNQQFVEEFVPETSTSTTQRTTTSTTTLTPITTTSRPPKYKSGRFPIPTKFNFSSKTKAANSNEEPPRKFQLPNRFKANRNSAEVNPGQGAGFVRFPEQEQNVPTQEQHVQFHAKQIQLPKENKNQLPSTKEELSAQFKAPALTKFKPMEQSEKSEFHHFGDKSQFQVQTQVQPTRQTIHDILSVNLPERPQSQITSTVIQFGSESQNTHKDEFRPIRNEEQNQKQHQRFPAQLQVQEPHPQPQQHFTRVQLNNFGHSGILRQEQQQQQLSVENKPIENNHFQHFGNPGNSDEPLIRVPRPEAQQVQQIPHEFNQGPAPPQAPQQNLQIEMPIRVQVEQDPSPFHHENLQQHQQFPQAQNFLNNQPMPIPIHQNGELPPLRVEMLMNPNEQPQRIPLNSQMFLGPPQVEQNRFQVEQIRPNFNDFQIRDENKPQNQNQPPSPVAPIRIQFGEGAFETNPVSPPEINNNRINIHNRPEVALGQPPRHHGHEHSREQAINQTPVRDREPFGVLEPIREHAPFREGPFRPQEQRPLEQRPQEQNQFIPLEHNQQRPQEQNQFRPLEHNQQRLQEQMRPQEQRPVEQMRPQEQNQFRPLEHNQQRPQEQMRPQEQTPREPIREMLKPQEQWKQNGHLRPQEPLRQAEAHQRPQEQFTHQLPFREQFRPEITITREQFAMNERPIRPESQPHHFRPQEENLNGRPQHEHQNPGQLPPPSPGFMQINEQNQRFKATLPPQELPNQNRGPPQQILHNQEQQRPNPNQNQPLRSSTENSEGPRRPQIQTQLLIENGEVKIMPDLSRPNSPPPHLPPQQQQQQQQNPPQNQFQNQFQMNFGAQRAQQQNQIQPQFVQQEPQRPPQDQNLQRPVQIGLQIPAQGITIQMQKVQGQIPSEQSGPIPQNPQQGPQIQNQNQQGPRPLAQKGSQFSNVPKNVPNFGPQLQTKTPYVPFTTGSPQGRPLNPQQENSGRFPISQLQQGQGRPQGFPQQIQNQFQGVKRPQEQQPHPPGRFSGFNGPRKRPQGGRTGRAGDFSQEEDEQRSIGETTEDLLAEGSISSEVKIQIQENSPPQEASNSEEGTFTNFKEKEKFHHHLKHSKKLTKPTKEEVGKFKPPKMVQRGFHPILPYSEKDPGPVRVEIRPLPPKIQSLTSPQSEILNLENLSLNKFALDLEERKQFKEMQLKLNFI